MVEAVHLISAGKQRAKAERGQGMIKPQDILSITQFFQRGPLYHFPLPLLPSHWESIRESIYALGQNPNDLLIFGDAFSLTLRGVLHQSCAFPQLSEQLRLEAIVRKMDMKQINSKSKKRSRELDMVIHTCNYRT